MRPVILYRQFDTPKAEIEAAKQHFFVTESRMDIQAGDLVIGRYSMLPFYVEQERDVKRVGAQVINSYSQHQYVADIREWYNDLRGITPFTWFEAADLPEIGPFVVKGITNSKKHAWKTHCFAQTKAEAIQVMLRLQDDTLISQQPIVFRQYVPLKQYMLAVNGMPITNEFRFFVCDKHLLCGAYYWSTYVEELPYVPSADTVPLDFLCEVIDKVGDKIRFYVVDIAETATGEWIVIELNDGQMSGLSENDPNLLYGKLKEVI